MRLGKIVIIFLSIIVLCSGAAHAASGSDFLSPSLSIDSQFFHDVYSRSTDIVAQENSALASLRNNFFQGKISLADFAAEMDHLFQDDRLSTNSSVANDLTDAVTKIEAVISQKLAEGKQRVVVRITGVPGTGKGTFLKKTREYAARQGIAGVSVRDMEFYFEQLESGYVRMPNVRMSGKIIFMEGIHSAKYIDEYDGKQYIDVEVLMVSDEQISLQRIAGRDGADQANTIYKRGLELMQTSERLTRNEGRDLIVFNNAAPKLNRLGQAAPGFSARAVEAGLSISVDQKKRLMPLSDLFRVYSSI